MESDEEIDKRIIDLLDEEREMQLLEFYTNLVDHRKVSEFRTIVRNQESSSLILATIQRAYMIEHKDGYKPLQLRERDWARFMFDSLSGNWFDGEKDVIVVPVFPEDTTATILVRQCYRHIARMIFN